MVNEGLQNRQNAADCVTEYCDQLILSCFWRRRGA